jgi:hypothetical protein
MYPAIPRIKPFETLAHLGIVSGSPCGNFLCYYPANPIRRDEMSSVASFRLLKHLEVEQREQHAGAVGQGKLGGTGEDAAGQ